MACKMARWLKQLQTQMKTSTFDPYYPNSIISLFSSFKLASDTNRIHEGVVIWIVHTSKKQQADAKPNPSLALGAESFRNHHKERINTLDYFHVVNYLLQTCSTDAVIVETDGMIMRFSQSPKRARIGYAILHWTKALQSNRVHEKYVTKDIFIDGLEESICKSIDLFWHSYSQAKMQGHVWLPSSLARVQNRWHLGERRRNSNKQ